MNLPGTRDIERVDRGCVAFKHEERRTSEIADI